MINFLLEVSPIRSDGTRVTLNLASRGGGSDGTQLDGKQWLPLITGQPSWSISWTDEGNLAETQISYEPVEFLLSDEPGIGNQEWANWTFQGVPCRAWRGNMGDPFSSYIKVYEGSAGSLDTSGAVARLPLLSVDHLIDRNLLTRSYTGTDPAGGSEGPSSLRGILKPFAAGFCQNIEPVLVDRVNNIYQYHGYGPAFGVQAVFEGAVDLGPPAATVTTWNGLAALDLKPGQWASAPAIGAFRLKSLPSNKITADVRGALDNGVFASTVGSVMALLIKSTGVSGSRVAPSLAGRSEAWCVYADTQTTVAEQLRLALLGAGCASIPTSDGGYAALDFFELGTPIRLDSEQTGHAIVQSYSQINVAPEVWQVRVQGARAWSVNSESEVLASVAQLSADAEANNERIRLAIEALDKAVAQAEADAKIIEEILSDGVLDRGEKAQQIARYDSEAAQHVELMASSERYAVEAKRANYDEAFNALTAYLASIVPPFTDLTQSSPITSAYAAAWRSYDVAKIALLNAMTGDIKTIADNTKEIVDQVKEDVDQVRETLPTRVGSILMEPIERISALQLKASTANLKATKALSDRNALAVTTLETKVDEKGQITAEQITQLTSRVKSGEDTVEAGFLEVNRTIANTKEALSEQVVLTIAKYGESASASMVEERRVRAAQDQAGIEYVDQMAVDLTTTLGDKITGQINDVKQIIADADGAIGTRIEELGVKLVEDVEGEKFAREAAIQTVEKTIVDTNEASAGRIDTISSSYDALSKYVGDVATGVSNVDGRVDAVYSVIQTTQETSANANEARAEEIRNLESTLNNMNYAQLQESFETYASKVNGIGSQYTLKVQTTTNGETVVAGMGLAVENGVSAINFLADSFNISVPGVVTPSQVFKADSEGIYMPNVRADNIKAGAIDFEFINKQSLLNPDSGYQMLPGGLIIMWGRYRAFIRSETVFSISFPMPFPNVCLSFQATPYLNVFNNERDLWVQIIGQPSTTGANVATQAARSNDQNLDGFDWIAFGR